MQSPTESKNTKPQRNYHRVLIAVLLIVFLTACFVGIYVPAYFTRASIVATLAAFVMWFVNRRPPSIRE